MANHAYVTTRRKMTAEVISSIIDRLNTTIFKGCVKVEYHKATKEEPGWGQHTWQLTAIGADGKEYGNRVCWLEDERHFEMRHGGGTNFIWWIDCAICNEVALHYNGTWTDDGTDMKEKGIEGKYRRFRAFQRRWCGNFYTRTKAFKEKYPNRQKSNQERMLLMWWKIQIDEDDGFTPPEFCMSNWRYKVTMKPEIKTTKDLLPALKATQFSSTLMAIPVERGNNVKD